MIGRDRSCELRLGSALVSKFHSAIELRDGRIYLRDLGSTNGTVVEGRTLKDALTELFDGNRIQIGPVVCTLVTGRDQAETGPVERMIAGWLQGEGSVSQPYHGESQQTISFPTTEGRRSRASGAHQARSHPGCPGDHSPVDRARRPRCHRGAALLFPLPLRTTDAPPSGPLPPVRAPLERQAIGVLLVHHLRLDRAGGALRLCQAPVPVMAVLHQVRLTILVECHPTLDEAVLAAGPAHQSK